MLHASDKLEHRLPSLAQVLLESVGDRQLAAYWIYTHHRALDGRSACECKAIFGRHVMTMARGNHAS